MVNRFQQSIQDVVKYSTSKEYKFILVSSLETWKMTKGYEFYMTPSSSSVLKDIDNFL